MENLPKHIAIIPDGNRRWAKSRGRLAWDGHRAGAKNFEKITKAAQKIGIFCLTFWGGSYDNLTKRPEKELKFLKEVYRINFVRLLKNKDIFRNEIKVSVFGQWPELLSERIMQPIEKIIEKTKDHHKKFLNFLIGYNGTYEMLDAIKKIVAKARQEKNLEVTEELLKANLWTKDLPPVDLVIRTGLEGDPHWSNGFMMWDTADSQFYFTETLWPDFSEKEFIKAVESYAKRERRLGA
ncbi:MAG: polyprenyl diphosphate synthase [bacterium]